MSEDERSRDDSRHHGSRHGSRHSCRHCGLPVPASRHRGSEPGFCCFGCRFAYRLALPATALGDGEEVAAPPSTLLLRLGFGIFLALNVMVASWLGYSQELFGDAARARGIDALLPGLFSYLALFLTTLLVVMLGLPLLAGVLRPSRGSRNPFTALGLNAQTLIVIGVFAAYLLSALHTLRGEGSLYYDTAAMVLVIVTLGSYLEASAKRRATVSAKRVLSVLPTTVRVRRGAALCELPVDRVRPGELVQVRPGETVPIDGEVVEGSSRVDESSLTGESRPRTAEGGTKLLAGGANLDGQLWLRAEQVAGDTVLAQMERSLAAARAGRPPMQRLADRVAAVFVPGVVLIAVATFATRAWHGQAETGLLTALAVLLISCPCALGLAAPLACWHGLRRAAEHGILIDSAATLERAAAIDRLCFDKTGTLTRPEPVVERLSVAPGVDERQALTWAAGLESASRHPIAEAVVARAVERGIEPPLPAVAATVPGMGVEGVIDGRTLRLGSSRWVEKCGLADQTSAGAVRGAETGAFFLMDDERVLARFDLAETLRPGAAEAVDGLRRLGIEVSLLSGDRGGPTRRLAERLEVRAESELLPNDKVRRLAAARGRGRIAMVGDGINDAPVLASADIGIALGSASDLARRSGNVRLISDALDRVPMLIRIARDVRRRIRLNLLWAFGFNTFGIALAATGWLTPVFAALAMVLSSLIVVRISSRAGAIESPNATVVSSRAAVDRRPDTLPLSLADRALGLEG